MATEELQPNIQIHELLPKGICSICRKIIKNYKKTFTISSDEESLQEIEIKTTHTKCDKLVSRKNKIEERLLEIDYQLFVLRDAG